MKKLLCILCMGIVLISTILSLRRAGHDEDQDHIKQQINVLKMARLDIYQHEFCNLDQTLRQPWFDRAKVLEKMIKKLEAKLDPEH